MKPGVGRSAAVQRHALAVVDVDKLADIERDLTARRFFVAHVAPRAPGNQSQRTVVLNVHTNPTGVSERKTGPAGARSSDDRRGRWIDRLGQVDAVTPSRRRARARQRCA